MSDLPYVFHCTPCGKPHAGECPPKVKISLKVDPSSLDKALDGFQQAIASAVKKGLPTFPNPGDFYTYEVWNAAHGGWQASQAVYEIEGWVQHTSTGGPTTNTVRYKVPGGSGVFDTPLEAFDPAGTTLATGLTRWVGPLPNATAPPPGITYPNQPLPGLGSIWKCQLFINGAWTPPDHRRYEVTSVDPTMTTVAEQNSGSPTGSKGRWKYPNAAFTPAGWNPPLGNIIRFVP